MTISPELAAKAVGIAVAIGIVLPLLQSLLQKPWWTPRAKSITTVALAIVGGVAAYVVQNGVDFSDPAKIALWIVGAYTAATTLYARLLRPLGVTDYIENNVNAGETPQITDGPDDDGEPVDGEEGTSDDSVDLESIDAEPDGIARPRTSPYVAHTPPKAADVAAEVKRRERLDDATRGRRGYVDDDRDGRDDENGQFVPKG